MRLYLRPTEGERIVTKLVKNNTSEQQKLKEQRLKKKKQAIIVGCVAAVVCLCVIIGMMMGGGSKKGSENTGAANGAAANGTDTLAANASESSQEDVVKLDSSLTYYADIDIQDYGTITIQLDQESAPITTENFVNLAESGFYDGLTFHRIIEGFMMQGGDPNGNGTGGSGNTIVGEFSDNGHDNNLSHTRGAVSMARSSAYDSASSQFFIVHEDSTFLDGQYAVFGYVTEGMDIVDTICETAQPTDNNGSIAAADQPVITSVTIRTE